MLPRRVRRLLLGWALGILGIGAGVALLQAAGFDFGRVLGPCGFRQRTGLTCPTCGMTTATLAFVRGRWALAWHHQPAAALICTGLSAGALGALLFAGVGRVPRWLWDRWRTLRWWHWAAFLVVVVLAGWAVTWTRAWVVLH